LATSVALLSACRDDVPDAAAATPRIELKAAVAPFDSVTVFAPIEGRVAEVRVTEGAAVNPGALLVTLTNPTVARDLVYARSAVATAEERMGSRGAAPRPRAVPSDTERERVVAELVRTRQQRLDRMRRLLANGDVAKQDVENAEAELAMARRELAAEQQRFVDVAAAPTTSTAMLQIEADRARADLTFAEHRQSLLTIAAPAAGTIARLRVAPGRDVYARDPIADIVDARSASVQASIAPELLNFVRVGQQVDVRLMTIPARRFREPIARVIQPGSESGAAIIVNIPNPDRMLQPGTPAMLTIQ
jgi:multidrug resistance efflux pump